MIRQANERPEGMDEGPVIMAGLRSAAVIDAVKTVPAQWDESGGTFRTVAGYDVTNVSKKVVRIVMSYVDYINRNVWHKSEDWGRKAVPAEFSFVSAQMRRDVEVEALKML